MSTAEVEDAFFKEAEFGTAGIRGIIRPGTNGINVYQIRKVNTAFANYLIKYTNAEKTGIAIAYDNRHMSKEFAMECARVFANFNIKTYLFKDLRPTPELSYTVRKMKLAGGIVITASHNPPEYNGYKIYDEEGCQFTPEKIKPVLAELSKTPNGLDINVLDFEDVESKGLVHYLGNEIDEMYTKDLLAMRMDVTEGNIKALFSSQHGTAITIAREMFKRANFNVDILEEQCIPDPNFSNTPTPNPESPKAYDLMIEKANGKYDLLLTTDPDADRVGIAVLVDGEYKLLTGNQTGAILIEYLLSKLSSTKMGIPKNGIIFNTIVTSDLGDKIAMKYGVEVEKTLTGFKFIGKKIQEYNKNGSKKLLFGYEESYGYLINDMVRDKDSLQALMLILEAANCYKAQGLNLYDVLMNIYNEYGHFIEFTDSIALEGIEGQQKIDSAMNALNDIDPKLFVKNDINRFSNYKKLVDANAGLDGVEITEIHLPSTSAFKIYFKDG